MLLMNSVHAVTNLSINQEQYTADAETLWIVENRGILTRVASEKGFLEEMSVLLVCCDGHVRSAHRHFIEQVMKNKNSPLKQVILWTDYDQDGMMIAHELFQIVKPTQKIKWINPVGEVLYHWDDYASQMEDFLQTEKMEQETETGDVALWKKWIKL